MKEKLIQLEKKYEKTLIIFHKNRKKLEKITNEIQNLKEEIEEPSLKDMTVENADWSYLMSNADNCTRIRLNTFYRLLNELCTKHDLKTGSVFSSGYFLDTSQATIKISLLKDDFERTQKVIEVLKILLPHIKPWGDGYKRISIREVCLSLRHSYFLLFNEFGATKIITSREYQSELHDWKPLEITMLFIQQYIYDDPEGHV